MSVRQNLTHCFYMGDLAEQIYPGSQTARARIMPSPNRAARSSTVRDCDIALFAYILELLGAKTYRRQPQCQQGWM